MIPEVRPATESTVAAAALSNSGFDRGSIATFAAYVNAAQGIFCGR